MICEVNKISNSLGLHGRSSNKLVELASKFESKIRLINEGYDANNIGDEDTGSDLESYVQSRNESGVIVADAKSIIELLAIAVDHGSFVRVCAEGPDEKHAVAAIFVLINNKFGE